MALAAGASHLGVVGPMPSGPGILRLDQIRAITTALPEDVDTWLLTSKTDSMQIIREYEQSGAHSLQLVDEVSNEALQDLRQRLPETKLVQVIHVLDEFAVDEAMRLAEVVDVILLDSGNPNLQVKVLGGTGRTHNWKISKRIVELCPKPVYLAGGLKSSNVSDAIAQVTPYGLDLCSGVRKDGDLDENLLQEFMTAVRQPSQ